MNPNETPSEARSNQADSEQNWAKPVNTLNVSDVSSEAINLNVEGRRLTGPLQGFGQLWQKTYHIPLRNGPDPVEATPEEVVGTWKEKFADFWSMGNRFFNPVAGISPGDVAVLNLAAPGGMQLSTGIMVIYSDDLSFSFMTPQGHIFAGMNTFSAHKEDETTVAQIQLMVRASDPLYELGCRLGVAHKKEDEFWHSTLSNLAGHFGAASEVTQRTDCVDPQVQWSEATNIWHNAAIRTALYMPVHLVRRVLG